jgi:hypothetical protein
MRKLFILSVVLLSLSSCYNDSEEAIFPEIRACDTTNITFSGSVKSMISTYCISCHGNQVASSKGSGIKLEDYQDVAGNDRILGAIEHRSGYFPMPQSGGSVDSCSLNQFRKWINISKPNN